ncbi:MAG TPA: hypothetical protein PLE99_00760 [Candidatus Thiothrix moscowensis]|uniref:hypothetical protein n=1 Tax=unclassified Thiothrix TaxID=2636184 RepID=UPI0025E4DDE3|nr:MULTISPECIES: hypothetical protein [unclassified Thiothrix]HRJ51266.1 hypothetical protein [Candidatus Thiothrix moscowensis]HRJ91679.1 hypothetical protein [Candidatus Thiothrix moscowensis]
MITQTRNKPSISFDFSELQTSAQAAQNIDVRGIHEQTAKFWDYYPHLRRQYRLNDNGGFFVPVDVPSSGYMPGVRGLKYGANRNKRVVSVRTIVAPGNFCQLLKPYGVTAMNAISHPMGNPARRASAHLTVGGVA